MASYQEIAQQVEILNEKVEFLMTVCRFPVRMGTIDPKMGMVSALQLYQASRAAGLKPELVEAPKVELA